MDDTESEEHMDNKEPEARYRDQAQHVYIYTNVLVQDG